LGKDLRNQIRDNVKDIKVPVLHPRLFQRLRGLGLVSKESNYDHLEPLLEKMIVLLAQVVMENGFNVPLIT
jgi:hypothetical protein